MVNAPLTSTEIAKHNSAESCWVIIHGKAYDVTDFLPEHPGGSKIILKYAGKDATEEFDPIHPPDTLEKYLDPSKHMGEVDMSTVVTEVKAVDPYEAERQSYVENKPALDQCYNLLDFEAVAKRIMKKTAWAYYSSGADDEITLRDNHSAFHRIWFRPKGIKFSGFNWRREKDMRSKFEDNGSSVQNDNGDSMDRSQGAARAISSFIDPSLSWKDIPWFKSITGMKIVLKGVQRVEDVIKACEAGVDGVVLSNHGGRQLDTAPSGIEILAAAMPILKERGLENKIEIYIDGGIRRASDIVKALCLGARGVGIGRPFLYAMSAYGLAGVDRAMQLLKDEMEMNMRLIGAPTIADLEENMVDTRAVALHSTAIKDTLSLRAYDPLVAPAFRSKL
ncbi:hypothetical protein TWF788_011510 [Orbilia oligospora]|uniref:Cytochrome b2, mitochondrial n=1 Tax=Orbilia oligospora TaxID=2813651 RepID=A0A7C8KAH1_ORBOL|nr:hypothetical protein TWF788_011510 [Orbilia oligospora]